MKTFFGVDPLPPPAKGIVVTLEGTNLLLTIILSSVALLALIAKATTNFNKVNENIRDLNKTLETNQKEREKLAEQNLDLQRNFAAFDKKFEIHLNEVKNLRENLASHSTVINEFKQLQREVSSLDKNFGIHQQDYVNHKDAVLLGFTGTLERISHKWERTKEELEKINSDVTDVQKYLHEQNGFIIRQRIRLDNFDDSHIKNYLDYINQQSKSQQKHEQK